MALPPLATVEQLAANVDESPSNPKLKGRLRDASRRFRVAVGWPVSRTEGDVAELNGDGGRILLLPVMYVESVASVRVDGAALPTTGAYRLDRRAGILERCDGQVWPTGLARVEVTYTHGFDAETKDNDDPPGLKFVPEGIQAAVLGMAETLLNTTPGVVSRTVLGDTIQFGAASAVGTTQDWVTTVDAYRIRGGA